MEEGTYRIRVGELLKNIFGNVAVQRTPIPPQVDQTPSCFINPAFNILPREDRDDNVIQEGFDDEKMFGVMHFPLNKTRKRGKSRRGTEGLFALCLCFP